MLWHWFIDTLFRCWCFAPNENLDVRCRIFYRSTYVYLLTFHSQKFSLLIDCLLNRSHTTRLESVNKKIIYIRKFSAPNQDVQQIYNLLNYKEKAFNQRKDVVTPIDTKKNVKPDYQQIIQT